MDRDLPARPPQAVPAPRREPEAAVSVVIPALDEEPRIAAAIRSARLAGASEVLVVDGGSGDGTGDAARAEGAVVLSSPPGRARQMNAGAAASRGDVLLFLHADTTLPPDAARAVRSALRDPRVAGGAFAVRLGVSPGSGRAARALLALTGRMIGLRTRLLRSCTGDQGIFVRRDAFERAGRYPEIPLMEDVALSRRLARLGRLVLLPLPVVTSARRWESRGIARTILLMWSLRLLHRLGMSAERCVALYGARKGPA